MIKNQDDDTFTKPQNIVIFPGGQTLNYLSPYYSINLTEYFKKYFVFSGSPEEHLPSQTLLLLQLDYYERAVLEILEDMTVQLGEHYAKIDPITNKRSKTRFNYLYTKDGLQVKNIIHIANNVNVMIATQEEEFQAIDFQKLKPPPIEMRSVNVREILKKKKTQSRNTVNKTQSFDSNAKRSMEIKHIAKSFRDRTFLNKHLKVKLPQLNQTYITEIEQPEIKSKEIHDDNFSVYMENNNDKIVEKNKNKNVDNEEPLQQSLEQRNKWMEKFGISNRNLYELFSEFVSMLTISKMDSIPKNMADPLIDILPLTEDTKMSKYFKDKQQQQNYNYYSISYKDYMVPVKVLKMYSMAIKIQNKGLVDNFLHALGLEVYNSECMCNWETFILINCILKFQNATKETYIRFFLGVIDVQKKMFVKQAEYLGIMEQLLKGIFINEEDGATNAQHQDFTDQIIEYLTEKGLLTSVNDLDMGKFEIAMRTGSLDIEILKQSIK